MLSLGGRGDDAAAAAAAAVPSNIDSFSNSRRCHKLLNLIQPHLLQHHNKQTEEGGGRDSDGGAPFQHDTKTYTSSSIIAAAPHLPKWRHICLPPRLPPPSLPFDFLSGINKVFAARRLNRWISKCGRDTSA